MTVVAIDGPAGSGKSTVARLVAERLGTEVLDTGAMYRAVTLAVLQSGVAPNDAAAATKTAASMELEMVGSTVRVNGVDATTEIRGPKVSGLVSVVAAHPGVRAILRDLQRAWMRQRGGGVVEGRDIGSVVFPDADVKVFLVASPEVRAARRAGEGALDHGDAVANIAVRDRLDSTRADSPLVQADGALCIDTTDLSIDAVVAQIVEAAR